MIKRGLIETIFSAFSIERWNDHPRTAQFTEMDKQAHKAIIAWAIARTEEDRGQTIDWNRLISGGLFEFLHRVVLTDIKPPVFHRLMADPEQKRRLDSWVLSQLQPVLSPLPGRQFEACGEWFLNGADWPERHILSAAHYLATQWEFGFISFWSAPLYGIERTKKEIDDAVAGHADLPAVAAVIESRKKGSKEGLSAFFSLAGQLQFQKRWAQTSRLPVTSVLGHLFMVALLSWCGALEIGAGPVRRRNDFYCGLFHDLPEVLTRDIISPVKRSVQGLEELIKDVEAQEIQRVIFPLLPESWRSDLLYYCMDEFENRVRPGGRVKILQGPLGPEHDAPEFDGVDGQIVEAFDKLSAFVEASQSVRLGIAAPALLEGRRRILERFAGKRIGPLDIGALFDYFL